MSEQTPEQVCAALKASVKSLQLATLGENKQPHCGYTPFVFDGAHVCIFVSQLAKHTRDLMVNPEVAVMIIADEQDSKQIFARSRLSYQCKACVVDPQHSDYSSILDAYEARHGKMVSLLRQLPDFTLFRLTPVEGQFVMGFGKAYRLEGPNLDNFVHARSE